MIVPPAESAPEAEVVNVTVQVVEALPAVLVVATPTAPTDDAEAAAWANAVAPRATHAATTARVAHDRARPVRARVIRSVVMRAPASPESSRRLVVARCPCEGVIARSTHST
ncbi:MAG: hypothetical protein B7Z69_00380 [Actinobacteria bacterium 21-73-9]|nr:MAG: hypothetical protein B7Z69_00380 [Actinobacteria bacterium 21-73-9]